jgi:hypothetical protein
MCKHRYIHLHIYIHPCDPTQDSVLSRVKFSSESWHLEGVKQR